MRLGSLIAIFSVALAVFAGATVEVRISNYPSYNGEYGISQNSASRLTPNVLAGNGNVSFYSFDGYYTFKSTSGSYSGRTWWIDLRAGGWLYLNWSSGYWEHWNSANTQRVALGYFEGWQAPPESRSFTWTFTPEWAGSVVQVRATNGQTLGSWGLPSVMSSNYVLSSTITTNASLLNGASVFLDGVSAASLAIASTNANLNGFADRPGYQLEFDASYSGSSWAILRNDGSVAGSGSAATFGTVLSGRVTLVPKGSVGTVWTRSVGSDGLPGAWVNSGVTLQGNGNTSYVFVSNPSATPAPSPPLPSPSPQPSPSPAPSAAPMPSPATVYESAPDTNVVLTISNAVIPSADVGEQGALDKVSEINSKFAQGLTNFGLAYRNFGLTFEEFRRISLPSPGTQCTFTIGPVSVNLSQWLPSWVREASKLVFLFCGLAAMWRFLNYVFE